MAYRTAALYLAERIQAVRADPPADRFLALCFERITLTMLHTTMLIDQAAASSPSRTEREEG